MLLLSVVLAIFQGFYCVPEKLVWAQHRLGFLSKGRKSVYFCSAPHLCNILEVILPFSRIWIRTGCGLSAWRILWFCGRMLVQPECPPFFCLCIHDFILSFYSMCHTELSTTWITLEMWKINSKLTNISFLQKHSNSHMNVKYQDQNHFL